MEYRERTGCQKQTAGTLFAVGTSLNSQQVLERALTLTYSQPTTQRLARRAPMYPSRVQAIDTSNSSASARKNERLFCKLSLHSLVCRAATPNCCARAILYTRSAPRAQSRGARRDHNAAQPPHAPEDPRDPVPRLLLARGADPRPQAHAGAAPGWPEVRRHLLPRQRLPHVRWFRLHALLALRYGRPRRLRLRTLGPHQDSRRSGKHLPAREKNWSSPVAYIPPLPPPLPPHVHASK